MTTTIDVATDIRARVDALDWTGLRAELDDMGHAVTAPVLDEDECEALADLFDSGRFRSTIEMARYRFGDGRYRYFDHPLPDTIAALRASFYRHLAPIANDWAELLRGDGPSFPLEHDELLRRCHAAGQKRPTPLILRYGEGDWNALHQDLYGDVFFPFQVLTILFAPRRGLRRRAVRPARAAAAGAEPGPRAHPRPGGVRDLSDRDPPEPGQERLSPRRHAPRRRHDHPGAADRPRRDLPRRYLSGISSPSPSATGIGSTTSSALASGSRCETRAAPRSRRAGARAGPRSASARP